MFKTIKLSYEKLECKRINHTNVYHSTLTHFEVTVINVMYVISSV